MPTFSASRVPATRLRRPWCTRERDRFECRFSQIAAHQPYGGVVPELASREHLKAIVPVVRKALADAGQTYQSIDALAVTQGPGLAGRCW